MFLLHAALRQPDESYGSKLARMAGYLDALLGPSRALPFLGDDDGGRLFHPYGRRDAFGRASMATAALLLRRTDWTWDARDSYSQAVWWLGPQAPPVEPEARRRESHLFADAGVAVMVSGDRQVIVDAGTFGPWRAGHSHADTLSLMVRAGAEEILVDPGTFTYSGPERDWFRGTGAHNTIRIDGLDQASPVGAFAWANPPEVSIVSWTTDADCDLLEAECRYAGFVHRRRVEFQKPDLVLVTDDVSGPAGEHGIEQLWHLGSMEARPRLALAEGAETLESWRSCAYGEKRLAPLLVVRRRCALPLRLEARILLSP
jgi:hypothetical protein